MNGKVTTVLASHVPCIMDLCFIHLWAQGLQKGDEHPNYIPLGMALFILALYPNPLLMKSGA